MSYTQEQIDRANQVDLEQFLRTHGESGHKKRKRVPMETA